MARKKVPASVRRTVYERDDWTCQYCARRIDPENEPQRSGAVAPLVMDGMDYVWLELDHVTPHAAAGADTVDNFRAACSPCNRIKSDSTVDTGWESRLHYALTVITQGKADRATVQAAARALLGVNVSIDERGRVTL
ncbi:HNH endonuclease [Rhodococcus pyridinivorans]|uniref:HNH endonuclease n=1 Tax=Rhodococcus pyridinivorans TaxID=103816 RepID=UPI003AACAF64